MGRCCGVGSDSEEDSLLDPASHRRRSQREVSPTDNYVARIMSDRRQRSSPARRETNFECDDPRDQTALKNSVLDGVYGGLTKDIGLTPVENPISPQMVIMKAVGTYSVSLPPNLYSAAISAALYLGGDNYDFLITRDIPVFLCTTLSLVLQLGLAFQVAWMQFDERVEMGTCALGGKSFVRAACVVAFSMHMLGEVMELLDMHFWLNMLRYANQHMSLEVRLYQDRAGHSVFKPVTGITYLERFLLYSLIMLPKLACNLSLLVFGIPYIVYARRNEDLLLNTVAMLFVAEIDEIVFRFGIPKMFRDTLIVPAFGRSEDERARCCELCVCSTIRSYVKLVVLAFVATLMYFFWCQN